MPYDVATKVVTENNGAESYLTYAGDVAIGFDTPTDGNVAEQAPVDAGRLCCHAPRERDAELYGA